MKKYYYCFFLVIALAISGCSKDDEGSAQLKSRISSTLSDAQTTIFIEKYSTILSYAINNREIRSIIKNSALLKFDDDYDVLAKHFHSITMSDGRKVGQFIDSCYRKYFYTSNIPNGYSFSSDITSIIPNLQISVPVHINDWDVANFLPIILSLPADIGDGNVTTLKSYHNGKQDVFDVRSEPNFPVLIVGISERINNNGVRIRDSIRDARIVPVVSHPEHPDYLTIHYAASNSIIMRWNDVEGEDGYYIYSADNHTIIDSTTANDNMYAISGLVTGNTYSYTVRAKYGNTVSPHSNTAKIKATDRGDNKKLIVEKLFLTRQRLRDIEPWFFGGPELQLYVYSSNRTHDSSICFYNDRVEMSRDEIIDTWYHCNVGVTESWDENINTILFFAWDEVNRKLNYDVSVNAKYCLDSLKVGEGIVSINATATYKSSSGDLVVARKDICFWDPKINTYSQNGFSFGCTSR